MNSLSQLRETASREVQELNPEVFREVHDEDRAEYTTKREIRERYQHGQEAAFQADAEDLLCSLGYRRRTSTNIQHCPGGKWFVHFPRTKGNPIVMDLVLFNSQGGRYIEIELKTMEGTLTPDQRALVARGEAYLCRDLESLRRIVETWERGEQPKHGG